MKVSAQNSAAGSLLGLPLWTIAAPVFAAVMIILNGIIGLCLLVGGAMHREQNFGLDGVGAALVALRTIVILTLVFPNYTVTTPGPYYAPSQLMLIAIVSLVIYGAFVFTQTIGHRQFFLRDIEVEEKGRLFACYWRILRSSQPARRGFGNMHGSFSGEYR